MTESAVSRISRISFRTDMRRMDAPIIPLGFMLEAAWPNEIARWLGLIGRGTLTEAELERVNLTTWPELKNPFEMLDGLFEDGWQSPWGQAGARLEGNWARSAFLIETRDFPLPALTADTDGWASSCETLWSNLRSLRSQLAPTLAPPVSAAQRVTGIPAKRRPMDMKMLERETEPAMAA